MKLRICPWCHQLTLRLYAGVGGTFVMCSSGCRRVDVVAALTS